MVSLFASFPSAEIGAVILESAVNGWGYAVFGKVTDGLDVVDMIRKVKTGNAGFHQDVPAEDVIIEKASVIEA